MPIPLTPLAESIPASKIFARLVVSAVAVLFGIFTKLQQGGGGLVNNLMVMSYYLSSAPAASDTTTQGHLLRNRDRHPRDSQVL